MERRDWVFLLGSTTLACLGIFAAFSGVDSTQKRFFNIKERLSVLETEVKNINHRLSIIESRLIPQKVFYVDEYDKPVSLEQKLE